MRVRVTNDVYKLAHDSTEICVICQDLLWDDDEIVTLECAGIKRKNKTEGHSFHITCMEKYAAVHGIQNLSCPMCRRPLNQEEIFALQSAIQPDAETDGLQMHQGRPQRLVPVGTLQGHIGVGTIIRIHSDEFELFQDTWVHNFNHDEGAVNIIRNAFVITDMTNDNLQIDAVDRYVDDDSEIHGEILNWALSTNDLIHIIDLI